jgi:hypothetical protein
VQTSQHEVALLARLQHLLPYAYSEISILMSEIVAQNQYESLAAQRFGEFA